MPHVLIVYGTSDVDYTDYEAVRRFAGDFADSLTTR
jgi:hypothetical protein